MAVPATNGGPQKAPKTEPKAAPKDESKKPADNTVAKQSPQAAKSAVNNAFGDVPKSGNAKQPDNATKGGSTAKTPDNNAKLAVTAPKDGTTASPTAHTTSAPSDAKGGNATPSAANAKSAPSDAKGGTANPPAADAKAAPSDTKGGTANPPASDPKAAPSDAKGGTANPPASDSKAAPSDAKGGTATPSAANAKTAPSDAKGGTAAQSAADAKAAPSEPGSPVKDANGTPVKTPDGKSVVLDENKNPVPVNDDGTPYADSNGNPYAVNDTGKYRATKDGYVVYDKTIGGKAVAIDSKKGTPVGDYNGNPLVVLPDDTYANTVDGKVMVYPKGSDGKIAAFDWKTMDLFKGPQDKIFMVRPDGLYQTTVDGKYVAYGAGPDGKYVAVSDGNVFSNSQGYPYSVTAEGNYMQPEPGKFGVLNKYNKIVASDATTGGIFKDVNGHAYVVDDTGKYMQPETGKYAVFNEQTGKTIATDGKGNPVTDGNGNPYLVDDNGQYAKTADGQYAVYTPKVAVKDLTPVNDSNQAPAKTSEGLSLYQDQSGKYVGVTNGGLVVDIDQTTGNMVTDPATGNPIVLNDPFAERPLGADNLSLIDTLATLPDGTERGDPMKVKNELFKDGVLDKESLYAALGKYDARDVYDALINSTKYGGWDKIPKPNNLVHPDAATAKALIAGMMAWQTDNAAYGPMKEGEVPPVLAIASPIAGYSGYEEEGIVYINMGENGLKDLFKAESTVYHELNHAYASDAFEQAVNDEWKTFSQNNVEVVTEYLADQWSKLSNDSAYDKSPMMGVMDYAMSDLGGGNKYAGIDILKKAYFQGDPVAIKLFLSAVKKQYTQAS